MPQRRKSGTGTKRRRDATRKAVAQTSRISDAREAARTLDSKREARPRAPGDRDPFTGELRRRGVLPMLVLHFMSDGPSYGNALMEQISGVTAGVLQVNPNTMYPLLRQLEEQGLVHGEWEHPERRSRRYYSLTNAGRREYRRLVKEVRPLLESIGRSIEEIVREVYGK